MTVPKRFGVLRFFGTLLKVIALIVFVLSILGAVAAVFSGGRSASMFSTLMPGSDITATIGTGGGIIAALGIVITGMLWFIVFYVAGEQLHMSLAIEENTRLTAALLLRMHQEGQNETTATSYGAGGGFVSEPYDS